MLLKTCGIDKQFNGSYALKDVGLEIKKGEIHGLVGENGAGKSTLIKILAGVYSSDTGIVIWDGREERITGPKKSRELGISVIHQDRQLIPSFNGIENAYLGLEYNRKKNGLIDWAAMRKKVQLAAEEYGIDIDLDSPVSLLSPPEQTMICLIRAVMTDCRLLILDEPTASLSDRESEILFKMVRRLRDKGTSVLYVTHRMEEIFLLTDRVTVMKNGVIAGTLNTHETDKDSLIGLMTDGWEGESLKKNENIGGTALNTEHVSSKDGAVKDVSLSVKKGEILGVFGLGGSGRTEFLETIYGSRKMNGGKISLFSDDYIEPSPKKSIARGLVMLCEDRRKMELVLPFSVRKNMTLPVLSKFSSRGIINEDKERYAADEKIEALQIKTRGTEQPMYELSGGNQQKVVFAKALLNSPKILLCDEPTQAVDVRTRHEIHKLLRDSAKKGCAVVFVSSDLKELLEIADKVQVIVKGRSRELLENQNLSAEDVLKCCYREIQESF